MGPNSPYRRVPGGPERRARRAGRRLSPFGRRPARAIGGPRRLLAYRAPRPVDVAGRLAIGTGPSSPRSAAASAAKRASRRALRCSARRVSSPRRAPPRARHDPAPPSTTTTLGRRVSLLGGRLRSRPRSARRCWPRHPSPNSPRGWRSNSFPGQGSRNRIGATRTKCRPWKFAGANQVWALGSHQSKNSSRGGLSVAPRDLTSVSPSSLM